MGKSSTEQIEQDEKRVLDELIKNANKSINDISKYCGFSRQKTWRIIKKLEAKKLIWGYTTVFDEEKIKKIHFTLLIKKSLNKLDEKIIEQIISTKTEALGKQFGISIESSIYVHGEFDWILTFTADDIKKAKKFTELLLTLYPKGTQKTIILQTLMFIRKNYVLNPERNRLKEFL